MFVLDHGGVNIKMPTGRYQSKFYGKLYLKDYLRSIFGIFIVRRWRFRRETLGETWQRSSNRNRTRKRWTYTVRFLKTQSPRHLESKGSPGCGCTGPTLQVRTLIPGLQVSANTERWSHASVWLISCLTVRLSDWDHSVMRKTTSGRTWKLLCINA